MTVKKQAPGMTAKKQARNDKRKQGKRRAVTGRGKFADPWAFFAEKCGMTFYGTFFYRKNEGGRLLGNGYCRAKW